MQSHTNTQRQIGNSANTFCLSVIKKKVNLVFHIRFSYATHCFFNLAQQEATADTVILSLHLVSLYHTHSREKPPTIISSFCLPSHYPSLFFFSFIVSETDSPTDLLSACRPSLLEFMEEIKCNVKLDFLLNSPSL